MLSFFVDLHAELLEACLEEELNRLLQLAYYQTDAVQALIKGDLSSLSDAAEFKGDFKPGQYLHLACSKGSHDIAGQLINLGADVNMSSKYGSPFQVACRNGKLKVIKLLGTHGVEIHPTNIDIRESGIYAACQCGQREVVEYLLELKADILAGKTEGFSDGSILLHTACESGHFNIVQLLVEKGVDINSLIPTEKGCLSSPLRAACENNHYSVVEYLLEQHAEVTRDVVEQFPNIFVEPLERYV